MCLIPSHTNTTFQHAVRMHMHVSFSLASPPFKVPFSAKEQNLFLSTYLFLTDTKLTRLALLLQIFNHPQACGDCGLHNVHG